MSNYISVLSRSFARALCLAGVVALALGINYLSAWTGPTALPPNNNTAAPINVSQTPQVKDGNVSVGKSTNTVYDVGLSVYGATAVTGEIQGKSTGVAQLRLVGGSYGAMFRNDGSNTYLLLTNPGDQYGSWNSTRPFYVNDSTGEVGMQNSLWVSTPNNTKSAIVAAGPTSGSAAYATYAYSGAYNAGLARADGYSLVGTGEIYNNGIIRSTSGGVAFPDGTVQTTAASSAISCESFNSGQGLKIPFHFRCGTAARGYQSFYYAYEDASAATANITYRGPQSSSPIWVYYNQKTGAYVGSGNGSPTADCQVNIQTVAANSNNQCL